VAGTIDRTCDTPRSTRAADAVLRNEDISVLVSDRQLNRAWLWGLGGRRRLGLIESFPTLAEPQA